MRDGPDHPNAVMLKVGDLAKKTGLTIRTLHHYHDIGLLVPSGRSEAGYRLYRERDVARLHAIQALRQFGLTLAEIGELLDTEGISLQSVVSRQIRALDQEIARARELRSQLDMLEDMLSTDQQPAMNEWLATLNRMATYRNYFSHHELKRVFRNWKKIRADWLPLTEAVRHAKERYLPPQAPEVQILAQRWMDCSMQWMHNDLDMARQWGRMVEKEPAVVGQHGLDSGLIEYIGQAIQLRMEAFQRHLSSEDIQRLDKSLHREWARLSDRAASLMQANAPLDGAQARTLAAEWNALIDRMTRNDPALRGRLLHAYRVEPLLRIGHVVTEEIRDFVDRIQAAAGQA